MSRTKVELGERLEIRRVCDEKSWEATVISLAKHNGKIQYAPIRVQMESGEIRAVLCPDTQILKHLPPKSPEEIEVEASMKFYDYFNGFTGEGYSSKEAEDMAWKMLQGQGAK